MIIFFLKIDGLQFVMKWSFQLVGIRQHNIQDKVTKLNSTTVLADKMISVPAYSSKEFSWWNAFIWEISYAMCYLIFFNFLQLLGICKLLCNPPLP